MNRDLLNPAAVVIDAEAEALVRFVAIEKRIGLAEKDGIVARWEFGRVLLAERDRNGGKQLPNGRLAEVCAAVGVSQAEVRNRMQFAVEHRTRDQVATAVVTCGSWTAVRDQLGDRGQPTTGEIDATPFADATLEECEAVIEQGLAWMHAHFSDGTGLDNSIERAITWMHGIDGAR